jgi:molybdate transport system ATP-binding protein
MIPHDLQEPAELNPPRLAAILYGPGDDADALLDDFVQGLALRGVRVGGIVQRNTRDEIGRKSGMDVIDLGNGDTISICQDLGSGSTACKLDAAGLAEAGMAVHRAIAAHADLIVINKFSKQEASGSGLRDELAEAITSGIPVLTAVPRKCIDDWRVFTGGVGILLQPSRPAMEAWWLGLNVQGASAG